MTKKKDEPKQEETLLLEGQGAEPPPSDLIVHVKEGDLLPPAGEIGPPSPIVGDARAMLEAIAVGSEARDVLVKYIDDKFTEGIDYGPADERNKKPTLLKPGAEKVCRLFNTRPVWIKDVDTYEMLGSPSGTVCYICQIVDSRTGEVIGEGRGAGTVGDKSRDTNKTIKNAEKCALVDAALWTFCLSEKFTQDILDKQRRESEDGSPPARTFQEEKDDLKGETAEFRQGCDSSLTDNRFLVSVCEQELHKKGPATIGEIQHLRKVIIIEKQFDPATSDRIPKGAGS